MKHQSLDSSPDAALLRVAQSTGYIGEIQDPTLVQEVVENDRRRKEILVRRVRNSRARRTQFFSGKLFSDPAWDILLELYAAELAQHRIAIGAVSVSAAVPETTGLRWINALEQRGLVSRQHDPFDARRVYVRLTEIGMSCMNGYFAEGS